MIFKWLNNASFQSKDGINFSILRAPRFGSREHLVGMEKVEPTSNPRLWPVHSTHWAASGHSCRPSTLSSGISRRPCRPSSPRSRPTFRVRCLKWSLRVRGAWSPSELRHDLWLSECSVRRTIRGRAKIRASLKFIVSSLLPRTIPADNSLCKCASYIHRVSFCLRLSHAGQWMDQTCATKTASDITARYFSLHMPPLFIVHKSLHLRTCVDTWS